MAKKPLVVVDPLFRRMEEIFAASDLARLHDLAEVIWGGNEPMPLDQARDALKTADAILCSEWR